MVKRQAFQNILLICCDFVVRVSHGCLMRFYISHIDDVKIDRLTRFTQLIQMMLRLTD